MNNDIWQPELLKHLTRPLHIGNRHRAIAARILARMAHMLGDGTLADEILSKWQSFEGIQEGALPLVLGIILRREEQVAPPSSDELRPIVIIQRTTTQPSPSVAPNIHEEHNIVNTITHYDVQPEVNRDQNRIIVQPGGVIRDYQRENNDRKVVYVSHQSVRLSELTQSASHSVIERFHSHERFVYKTRESDTPIYVSSNTPNNASLMVQHNWLSRRINPLHMTMATQQHVDMARYPQETGIQPSVWLMRKLQPIILQTVSNKLSQQVAERVLAGSSETMRSTIGTVLAQSNDNQSIHLLDRSTFARGDNESWTVSNVYQSGDNPSLRNVNLSQQSIRPEQTDIPIRTTPSDHSLEIFDEKSKFNQPVRESRQQPTEQVQPLIDAEQAQYPTNQPTRFQSQTDRDFYAPIQNQTPDNYTTYQQPPFVDHTRRNQSSDSPDETQGVSENEDREVIRSHRKPVPYQPTDSVEDKLKNADSDDYYSIGQQPPLIDHSQRFQEFTDNAETTVDQQAQRIARRNPGYLSTDLPDEVVNSPDQAEYYAQQPSLVDRPVLYQSNEDVPYTAEYSEDGNIYSSAEQPPLIDRSQSNSTHFPPSEHENPTTDRQQRIRGQSYDESDFSGIYPANQPYPLIDRTQGKRPSNTSDVTSSGQEGSRITASQRPLRERTQGDSSRQRVRRRGVTSTDEQASKQVDNLPVMADFSAGNDFRIAQNLPLVDRGEHIISDMPSHNQSTSPIFANAEVSNTRFAQGQRLPSNQANLTPETTTRLISRGYQLPQDADTSMLARTQAQRQGEGYLADVPTLPSLSNQPSSTDGTFIHSQPLSRVLIRLREQVTHVAEDVVQRHITTVQAPPESHTVTRTYTTHSDEQHMRKSRLQETTDIEVLVDKVMRRITQQLRIERERRGGGS